MATQNEKFMALVITQLSNELASSGVKFSESLLEALDKVAMIPLEETEGPTSEKSSKKTSRGFVYEGLEFLKMSQEERDKLNYCRFSVLKDDKAVLTMFWDNKLERVLQPLDIDNDLFTPGMSKKIPTAEASWRPFFKKLAEEEELNAGAFADKFYKLDSEQVEILRTYKLNRQKAQSA